MFENIYFTHSFEDSLLGRNTRLTVLFLYAFKDITSSTSVIS